MQRMIEQLRNKSVEDRRAIALSSAIGVTVVLLLGWSVSSLSLSKRVGEAQIAAVSAETTEVNLLAPITGAFQDASNAYQSGIEELKRIQQGGSTYSREGAYETGTVVPIPAQK